MFCTMIRPSARCALASTVFRAIVDKERRRRPDRLQIGDQDGGSGAASRLNSTRSSRDGCALLPLDPGAEENLRQLSGLSRRNAPAVVGQFRRSILRDGSVSASVRVSMSLSVSIA